MKAPKYAHNLLSAALAWLAAARHDMGSELNLLAMTHSMTVAEDMPTVVCLCGSTRFKEEFIKANEKETLAGKIVLSVGHFSRATPDQRRNGLFADITPEQKVALDVLHKRKIDLADEILVVNVDGYVGESTASEIAYALAQGKGVRWLDQEQGEHYLRNLGNPFSSTFHGVKADSAASDLGKTWKKLVDEPTADSMAAARKAALKVGAFVAVQPEAGEFHVGHVRSLFQLSDGKDKVILEDRDHLVVCDEDLVIAVAKDGKEHEDALRSFYSSGNPLDGLINIILNSMHRGG